MSWQPIHHGSHVNWSLPDPLHGADPYLVWADGSAFASYGGLPPRGRMATLIELKPGRTVAELIAASGDGLSEADIPACYRVPGSEPRFLTAWPTAPFFRHLRTVLAPIVERAEISLPVVPERPRFAPPVAPRCGGEVRRGTGRKILMGVIDDGCAFAQYHLRDTARRTRVCRLWDQDDYGAFQQQGSVPADFGRGHEITGARLEALIQSFTRGLATDEDGCYATAGYDRLSRSATHGAHVTDVAAGAMPVGSRIPAGPMVPPTWAVPGDSAAADTTGIVFVQLPRGCLQDPSGGWLDVHVLDALHYILSCADEHTEQIVVNLSFGPERGPNNGTAMLEKAFEELAAAHPRLRLVLAAGNSFSTRGHAVIELRPGASRELHWQVMPGDETPSFVQLWMPDGRGGDIRVRLVPPGEVAGGWLAAGDASVWPAAARPACAVIYPPATSRGRQGTVALVAIQPSSTFDAGRVIAPDGLWRIELRNEGGTPATVQGWIDKDDFNVGTLVRGRQSHFVDPLYDPLAYLRAQKDDVAGSGALVRRRGTLTGISTGSGGLVAAGYRDSDHKHVKYSSAGPTRGSRTGPDAAAVTDQARSLPGLLAAGTRGASVMRLVGTSVAAPEFARWIADGRPPPGPIPSSPPDPQLQGSGLLPLSSED